MAYIPGICSFAPPLRPSEGRLSSPYGYRPGRRTGERTFHAGADFAALGGTDVLAVANGVVERVTKDDPPTPGFNGYGNAVVLRHEGVDFEGHTTLWTFYAHLSAVSVPEGAKVRAGTPIGAVGNTSNGKFPGMGVHLHLELRRAFSDGSSPFPGPYRALNLDPLAWLAQQGVTFTPHPAVDADRACSDRDRMVVAFYQAFRPVSALMRRL